MAPRTVEAIRGLSVWRRWRERSRKQLVSLQRSASLRIERSNLKHLRRKPAERQGKNNLSVIVDVHDVRLRAQDEGRTWEILCQMPTGRRYYPRERKRPQTSRHLHDAKTPSKPTAKAGHRIQEE